MSWATEHLTSRLTSRPGMRRCHVMYGCEWDGWAYPGIWPNTVGDPVVLVESRDGTINYVPPCGVEFLDPYEMLSKGV